MCGRSRKICARGALSVRAMPLRRPCVPPARSITPRRATGEIEGTAAYNNTRGFHVYDAVQSGFAVSYAMPFHRAYQRRKRRSSATVSHPVFGGHAARFVLQFSGCKHASSSGHISVSVYSEARSYEDLPSSDLSSERPSVERVRIPYCARVAAPSGCRTHHPCRRAGRLRLCDRCEWRIVEGRINSPSCLVST